MNLRGAEQYGRDQLTGSESPEIDSQILLCHVLAKSVVYLHTWPERLLDEAQLQQFNALLALRQLGHPVAHLIGQRGFWSLDLEVTKDTLIPRPDTELLVSLALDQMLPTMTVADLGTGSGAVALSLAIEHPHARILATDYSFAALSVAKRNAKKHGLDNVQFYQGSWLMSVAENSLDLVVSNPPYIEQDDPHLSQGDVRFEPLSALVSGQDGLDDIRLIITQAKYCLKPESWLLIEHGYHQAASVQSLFTEAGFSEVSSEQDYGGNDRVTLGKLAV
ncbi:MAG: protein-(glutamine-N5) methyltransferase, release factor-specific [Gammaproteobacteria bacterium]|nr:MAG: protein-(glutamine-N5) methyltransferase, release factor-specific [Gammaproteobacteria bacterium]